MNGPLRGLGASVPTYTEGTPPGGVANVGVASVAPGRAVEHSVAPVVALSFTISALENGTTKTDPSSTSGEERIGEPSQTPHWMCPLARFTATKFPLSVPR